MGNYRFADDERVWKSRSKTAETPDVQPESLRDAPDVDDFALDTLVILWRTVLDDTDATLDDLVRSRRSFQFSADELYTRKQELRDERGKLELELEQLARTARLDPHRRPSAGLATLTTVSKPVENP